MSMKKCLLVKLMDVPGGQLFLLLVKSEGLISQWANFVLHYNRQLLKCFASDNQ